MDWSDVRVICNSTQLRKIRSSCRASNGGNNRLFKNGSLYLEEVFQAARIPVLEQVNGKNPVMVEAGKKAAQVRATATYTFEEQSKAITSLIHSGSE